MVQESLKVQLKTGIRVVKGFFNKEQRLKTISGVYRVNRVAYDVTQTVSVKEPLPQWPMINTGKEKVDLLRDGRVAEALCKQGMENCSVFWIPGQDGESERKLNEALHIAANSSGQYFVAVNNRTIKMFDKRGKFVKCYRLHISFFSYWLVHLATGKNYIYALVGAWDEGFERIFLLKFDQNCEKYLMFSARAAEKYHLNFQSVTVKKWRY